MKIIKRSVMMVLSILFLLCSYDTSVFAKKLLIGDYISLGKYQGEDIVWRYVADDENGKLFWSNDSICDKRFDVRFFEYFGNTYPTNRNHWESSTIKKWLNSDADAETVDTTLGKDAEPICEKGFLHKDNFTAREKQVIKTVTLNNIVDNSCLKDYSQAVKREHLQNYFYDTLISDENIIKTFDTYPKETFTERVFLIDYTQLSEIEKNKTILYSNEELKGMQSFWLRTPFIGMIGGVSGGNFSYSNICFVGYINNDEMTGEQSFAIEILDTFKKWCIRPAFYLNEENAQILSGSGTKEDPYVLDGKPVPERFEENGLYGYKDANGNVVVPAKYLKAWEFSEGAALVVLPEDPYRLRYIDTTGNYLFDKAFYASNNFNNGYALVRVADDSKYSYIDKMGEAATELLFDDAEDFCGGYARVRIDGKWGVVDTNFRFKVPCEYDNKDEVFGKLDLS